MHRSGTSLLTSILEELGFFSGHSQDDDNNHESIFFRRLNEWLLRQANSSWDNPYNFGFISPWLNEILCAALKISLRSSMREQYLGPAYTRNYSDIRDLDFPWGWKDPRSTFTIDVWGNVFPLAKVLHVYRNPIDVAASLRQREIDMSRHFQALVARYGIEYMIGRRTKQGINFQFSPRVEHLQEGIQLWSQYVNKAFTLDKIYGDRCMHVKYEDFLEQPGKVLARIAEFVGLSVDEARITLATRHINLERRYAFMNSPELMEVYGKIRNEWLIRALGY